MEVSKYSIIHQNEKFKENFKINEEKETNRGTLISCVLHFPYPFPNLKVYHFPHKYITPEFNDPNISWKFSKPLNSFIPSLITRYGIVTNYGQVLYLLSLNENKSFNENEITMPTHLLSYS